MDDFELKVQTGKETVTVSRDRVSVNLEGGLKLAGASVYKVDYKDPAVLEKLTPGELAGKVVLTEIPDFRREDRASWPQLLRAQNEFKAKMASLKVALVISLDRGGTSGGTGGTGRLIDPENRPAPPSNVGVPTITVQDPKLVQLHDEGQPGSRAVTISAPVPSPAESP